LPGGAAVPGPLAMAENLERARVQGPHSFPAHPGPGLAGGTGPWHRAAAERGRSAATARAPSPSGSNLLVPGQPAGAPVPPDGGGKAGASGALRGWRLALSRAATAGILSE